MGLKHLLTVNDLKKEDVDAIMRMASRIHQGHYELLKSNKILATLFFEPSTRTKLSFQSAMYKLGGQTIDLPINSSQTKGESDADTIKTISKYADVLVLRHPKNEIMEYLSNYSDVPVINAGDGSNQHPTQALIDAYTIRQYNHRKEELTIMFTGDLIHSRTVRSLLELLKLDEFNLDFKLHLISTCKYYPIENYINISDVKFTCIDENQIDQYIGEVDVLYMTRMQAERHIGKYVNYNKFIMTKELLDKMKMDAIIMHPLPRNEELPEEFDSNYRAKYFQQVKNGLFVRMALIKYII